MSEGYKDYYRLFCEVFDPNGTGFVSPAEVEATLIANGYLDEKTAVLDLISYLEVDRNGKISIQEVEGLLHPDFIKLEEPNNIADMFTNFDKDQDDRISIEDLKRTSEDLGLPLSLKQASLMIQAFDQDADGKVTLKEFSSIFNEAK
ncbi:hypothetical protein SteCoe_1570 [Stentor coeruleus]|uniref:EF-hand domain-containing protein n=1 Tax=Stentor coeruleus TaxID=5963 RepID=A0A1R2D1V4_9CILI|nr:hypothetical protein SteCoe_1570 [Stentor coeruleus]